MHTDAPDKQLSSSKVHQLLGAKHLTTEPGGVLMGGRVKIDKKKLEILTSLRDSLGRSKVISDRTLTTEILQINA